MSYLFAALAFSILSSAGEAPKPALSNEPQLKEYCQKYPHSVECKPTLVKQKLDSIHKIEDQKIENKMKDIDNN